jgi:predicted Rossmann fold nucleotide-binding protein DprA/Smf involved in DNA uptake
MSDECWQCGWHGPLDKIVRKNILGRPHRRQCPWCKQDLDHPRYTDTGKVLKYIDTDTALSIDELADKTGLDRRGVQAALTKLMDRGRITSTPGFKYRLARRRPFVEVADVRAEEGGD